MPDSAAKRRQRSAGSPVTIVTGATEGLGLALAREFARGGHALLLVARTASALEQAAGEIAGGFPVPVHTHAADLASTEGCASVEAALRANGLYANYLVNNAGWGHCGPFAEADAGTLTGLVDLNVRAATDLTRRFLPGMIARNAGGVLNVASLGAFLPGPHQAAYYASKAYILSLTEALAEELRGTNVRMAALAPGPLQTGFHERMGGHASLYLRFQGVMDAEAVAGIGYANFMCGQTVIIPGLINMATALATRLLPHAVLTPFTALLLKRRHEDSNA